MPKEEWGVKRVCPTTGKRFYDLNKRPVISPYSGDTVDIDLPQQRKSTATAAAAKKPAKPIKNVIDGDDELLVDDDAEVKVDDELLEDDDDDTVAFDDLADVAGNDEEES